MARSSSTRLLRLPLVVVGLLLVGLLLAPAAPALGPDSPITWKPADSFYGADDFQFYPAPAPAPAGTGMTTMVPGPGTVFGAGFWDGATEIYAMGFINGVPTSMSLPTMSQTELAGTVLPAGTELELVFDKDMGQHIDSVAILGDPDALIAIEPSDPAQLDAATQFTVYASVTDPVASASGDIGASFGLIVDCSTVPARDFQGSLFVTDMHWLDIDPPTFSDAGLAGLSAHGVNGVTATFDGIFSPAVLAAMGVTDPTLVQGYVDITAVTGWPGAALVTLGAGDGSLWPSGYWKYRLTNSSWSTHNIMFGKLSKPAKAVGVSPKGTITGTRPTFKWKKLGTAKTYEVRVYKGTRLLLKKTGATALSWRASKALPRGVYLTWKVRGSNSAGLGTFSSALKFKIR